MDAVNGRLLEDLNEFFEIADAIGRVKDEMGLKHFDPGRESAMVDALMLRNRGPMSAAMLKKLFSEIFKASIHQMDQGQKRTLHVHRAKGQAKRGIRLGDVEVGAGLPVLVAGPAVVESEGQLRACAQWMKDRGLRVLRAGVYPSQRSPYTFAGLGDDGLALLAGVGREFGLVTMCEVQGSRDVARISDAVDVLEVGPGNMHNYELLKEVGRQGKPVFLDRAFAATMEEFVFAAEYIAAEGNEDIVLCECGIRGFDPWTRSTLDIAAIPLLDLQTLLPVAVNLSLALGRKDILPAMARGSLTAGAAVLVVEVHPNPAAARAAGERQLSFDEMDALLATLGPMLQTAKTAVRS